MRKKRVYISSPYTGNEDLNAQFHMSIFSKLIRQDFVVPICPLVFHYWQNNDQFSYDEWIDYDLEILSSCDILALFLNHNHSSMSKGMEIEEEFAMKNGLFVCGPSRYVADVYNEIYKAGGIL